MHPTAVAVQSRADHRGPLISNCFCKKIDADKSETAFEI